MDVSRPYSVISHPLDSVVLQVLTGTTQGLSGRRIAELSGHAQEGVRKALQRLVEHGIVDQREAGNAILYQLNRRHLAASAVEQLTDMRKELLNRLTEAFQAWETPPLHASIFGSAARADGDSRSDIDLFVVRRAGVDANDRTWRAQIEELADDIRDWTGNHANVVEVSESDLSDLARRRPPALDSLEADALTLAGAGIGSLIGEERDG